MGDAHRTDPQYSTARTGFWSRYANQIEWAPPGVVNEYRAEFCPADVDALFDTDDYFHAVWAAHLARPAGRDPIASEWQHDRLPELLPGGRGFAPRSPDRQSTSGYGPRMKPRDATGGTARGALQLPDTADPRRETGEWLHLATMARCPKRIDRGALSAG